MPGRSIRVGRLAGIPVGIHPLWLVIVALLTVSLGEGWYPEMVDGLDPAAAYALGLASALLLFACLLLHELGHALIARRAGVEIEEIDLWLLGGVAKMRTTPQTARDELRIAAAGPAVSLGLAGVFGAALIVLPASAAEAAEALLTYQAFINTMIVAFNLLPALPLDGGRIFHAFLWMKSGSRARATRIAAASGRAFGYSFIALGLLSFLSGVPGGVWFAVMGLFLTLAAAGENVREELEATLGEMSAGVLMHAPATCIPERTTLADAAERYFLPSGFTAFPVVDRSGRLDGLVRIDDLTRVPSNQMARLTAGELAQRDVATVDEAEEVLSLLEHPAFQRLGRAVVVDRAGRPVGIVSITDVQRRVRASRLAAVRRATSAAS